jgi:NTE family protein
MTERRVDAVFEGGGVKGIGLVGAVAATEARGFVFENVAGTSAGAIVAALVAAGYSAAELEREMKAVDYRKFRDKDLLDRIPVLGPALSLGFERGIYEGAYFERWLDGLLAEKGKRTFGDLVMPEYADDPRFRYKLQVIAADISRGKLLVLPRDIGDYGLEPDELGIARAVRMSIPFFFEPVKLAESCIVDGGVLSFARTIPIPTLGVRTTDFDITDAERDALFESGREAAEHFLAKWDFERYKARYRKAEPPPRSERLF